MELETNNHGKSIATEETSFVEDIKQIVTSAKIQAYRAANMMQVASNWLLGWRIVDYKICSTAWSESQNEKDSTVWIQSPAIISQTMSDLLVKIGQARPAQVSSSY